MTLMDTAQLLGSLGDFVGAILIAITLIYLAVQVRQNTRALHTQSRQAALSCSQVELLAAVEHPDIHLAMLRGVNGLSQEENVKVYFWLTAVMRSREFAWLQYRDGNIDEMQWRQEAMVIQPSIGSGGNQLVVKYSPPSLLHLWMSIFGRRRASTRVRWLAGRIDE